MSTNPKAQTFFSNVMAQSEKTDKARWLRPKKDKSKNTLTSQNINQDYKFVNPCTRDTYPRYDWAGGEGDFA